MIPATPIATSVVPWRNGRPNESVTTTRDRLAGQLARTASRRRRALASGSTGSRTSVPGSGAFEWSTPAEAQIEPVAGLGDHERRRARGRSAPPRCRITSTSRGSRSSPASSRAFVGRLDVLDPDDPALGLRDRLLGDDDDVAVLELVASSAIIAPRSSPSRISGRPSTGMIWITPGRGRRSPGRRRAPCSAGSGSRSPRSAPRARGRSRAGPASSARPATSLPASSSESSFARASSPQTSASSSGAASSRFAAAIECRPAATGRARPCPARARRALRASGSGSDADSLAKLDRARDARAAASRRAPPATARAVSSAASALTASTARSAPRTASSFVAPVMRPPPSSSRRAPRALGVARADHDVVLAERDEPRRERAAEAAGAAEDRDPHAGAPAASSTVARRAGAPRSRRSSASA